MKTSLRIPNKFPSFNGWCKKKIEYLQEMADVNYSPFENDIVIEEEVIEENFVLSTREVQRDTPDNRCFVCNGIFQMYYDDDEEEWAYRYTKLLKLIKHNDCNFSFSSNINSIPFTDELSIDNPDNKCFNCKKNIYIYYNNDLQEWMCGNSRVLHKVAHKICSEIFFSQNGNI